jgi:hypothetical protein
MRSERPAAVMEVLVEASIVDLVIHHKRIHVSGGLKGSSVYGTEFPQNLRYFVPACDAECPWLKAGRKRSVNRASVNQCAQCGADIIAPQWSERLADHCIRNVWSCEACGYQFEDTVYLSAPESADA